jgi:hypothetical protein
VRGGLALLLAAGTLVVTVPSAIAASTAPTGPAMQRSIVTFAPGAADLTDAGRTEVTDLMDSVPGDATPVVRGAVVAFATQCRVRGDVCTDRSLARQRADNVAALLRGRGIDVRTRVRVADVERSDSVVVTLRYRIKPTATWTVVNGSTEADSFELVVEWATPSGGSLTSVGPGERVRADYVALKDGLGRVTMRILNATPGLRVEIRVNGFTGSPLCERPAIDGTPFTCVATGARGSVRIVPL